MHPDEQLTTAEQVAALVSEQMPSWADLAVTAFDEFGSDHCLFHLGDDLVVRMPRAAWAVEQVERDSRWLPVLAPHLPVPIPVPLAVGAPGEGFPWAWSVVPWVDGTTPVAADGTPEAAPIGADLAAFVTALHAVPASGGPLKQAGTRGAPIDVWDDAVAAALDAARDLVASRVDPDVVATLWERVRSAPPWAHDPVWLHGDLLAGNLLVADGRLAGVIDFGGLGLGDPAADLVPFWTTLDATERHVFRGALSYDDDTWMRALGWAMAPALTGLDYYRDSVPAFVERGLRTLEVVVAESA